MKELNMAIDIGSVSVKGVLIDSNNNIITKYSLKIKDDYVTTYGRVINKLRSSINMNEYKIETFKITGKRKRLIERSLGKEHYINDLISVSNYVINKYPGVKTIIDIGNFLKVISIKDNKIDDYLIEDINYYGKFIDKVIDILNINNVNDVKVHKSKVKFNNKNTILFNYNIISILLKKYSKEEILLGIYDLVVSNIIYYIKNIEVKSPIVLTGGLSLNKPFVKVLENGLNKKIIVLENSEYAAVLGSIINNKELIHK